MTQSSWPNQPANQAYPPQQAYDPGAGGAWPHGAGATAHTSGLHHPGNSAHFAGEASTTGNWAAGNPSSGAPSRPASISLGVTLASLFGVALILPAISVIAIIAIGLDAAGDVSSSFGSDLDNDVALWVLLALLVIVVAVALVWGSLAAWSGTTNKIAVAANVGFIVLILIGAIAVHPLLLVFWIFPVISITALLQPNSKQFLQLRGGTSFRVQIHPSHPNSAITPRVAFDGLTVIQNDHLRRDMNVTTPPPYGSVPGQPQGYPGQPQGYPGQQAPGNPSQQGPGYPVSYPGAPAGGPPAGGPPAYGQPAYPAAPAYPNSGMAGYGGSTPLKRPGMVTAAAVLAFIWGAFAIIGGLLVVLASSAVNSANSLCNSIQNPDADVSSSCTKLAVYSPAFKVLSAGLLIVAVLLIWGGVMAISGKSSQILLIGAGVFVIVEIISIIIASTGTTGFQPSSVLGVAVPVLIGSFLMNSASKAWFVAKGGKTF